MRIYAALPLILIPMFAQQLKVDHATVAGKDLRAMQRALSNAGIPTEYGGPHANHATEMALASFPDGSYLELIAVQAKADPAAVAANPWSKFLASGGEPCAWAVRPADMNAEVQRLHAALPIRNGRRRPDGVELKWETAQVGPGNGTFLPFLIHDFTPRELRAYPAGKPLVTNFTGIVKVFLAVKDIDEAIEKYRSAYSLPAPHRQDDPAFGAKLASFPETPVVLATPLDAQSWLAKRLDKFGEAPCAFVLGRTKPAKITWLDEKSLGWRLGLE